MAKSAYQGRYFSILLDDEGVEFVHTGDAVMVVPITSEGEVLVNVEPSPAFGEMVRVLPGGEITPGEAAANCADRELQEETGYKAGRLDYLGELRPFSKYLTVRISVYLGRDLSPSRLDGDEAYEIEVERVLLDEFEAWVDAGRLVDSSVIAAMYMARGFLDKEAR